MFRSARVKLTLFYLAILLACSLTVTLSIRVFAEHEYLRSNGVQRGEVRQLFITSGPFGGGVRADAQPFFDVQKDQEDLVRQRLNNYMVFVNVAALVVGGVLSYWFAGRTLKPIEEAHQAQARFAADA